MSLIHEALKKAEAQRHLGEAPTLSSPSFARRRRRRWLLPLVVLAAIVAGAYMAWSHWSTNQDSAAGANKTVSPHVASVVTASPDRGAAPATGKSTTVETHAAAATQGKPPAPSVRKSVNRPAPIHAAPAVKPAAAKPAHAPTATMAAAPTAAIKPLPQSATAHVAAPTATPAKTATSALPMYWQLPYAERKDLPEMKISMHVYAPHPADRFVIINGERQVEGDDLGNGMTLVAIRRDGIVVELNGQRFVVPSASNQ